MPVQLKKWIPFLTAFVLPILLIYAWWGGFNPVSIEENQMRGPYSYAYLEQQGDYAKLPDAQGKVGKALADQRIVPGQPITVLYSDPDKIAMADRKARTGYLIPQGIQLKAPLKQDTIPSRQVLLVQVRTAIMLAPSRAYQALNDYLKARNAALQMPTVEIYQGSSSIWSNGTLSVEMPLASVPEKGTR
jgi:hypothetical protein